MNRQPKINLIGTAAQFNAILAIKEMRKVLTYHGVDSETQKRCVRELMNAAPDNIIEICRNYAEVR